MICQGYYPSVIEDGVTDFYERDAVATDSNRRGGGFTTLTDAQRSDPGQFPVQGACQEPPKSVDFSWKLHIKNGEWMIDMVLDAVKYSNKKKLNSTSLPLRS